MARALTKFLTQQCWAVHEPVLRKGMEVIERHLRGETLPADAVSVIVAERDAKEAAKAQSTGRPEGTRAGPGGYYLDGTVAVVPIEGVITKYADMVNGTSQPAGTTTGAIVEGITNAKADPRARSVLLAIDSPGGSVAGMDDAVAAVRDAVASSVGGGGKPVWAFAHDLMASAAYWIGSQAEQVWTSESGAVGSIGVYTVLEDVSAALDKRGVKFHLVKAGKFKGVGAYGIAVSEQDLSVVQGEVDAYFKAFKRDVAAGRGARINIDAAADGRVWLGLDAQAMGLIDGTGTYAQVVAKMNAEFATTGPNRVAPPRGLKESAREGSHMTLTELIAAQPGLMAEHREQVLKAERDKLNAEAEAKREKPATIAELRAAFPGTENAEFRENCSEKSLTLSAAKAERSGVLAAQLEAEKKKTAEAQAEVDKLKKLNGAGASAEKPAGASPPAGETKALDASASIDQVKAAAKQQWAANTGACNDRFLNEAVYVAAKVREHKEAHAGKR